MVDYAASKSAARSFAEALSLEMKNLKKTGVRVTCVCPSHINTGLFQGFR
jgi:all-trans-retinol dehydrogenase (NAD+)